MSTTQDFTLSLQELLALGAQLRLSPNALSPLYSPEAPARSGRVLNPAVANPNGEIKPEAVLALKRLQSPGAKVAVAVINDYSSIEAANYFEATQQAPIVVINQEAELQIQNPAFDDNLAFLLEQFIGNSSLAFTEGGQEMSALQLLALLGAVDLRRRQLLGRLLDGSGKDDNVPSLPSSEQIYQTITTCQDNIQWLSAAFSISLDFAAPSKNILDAACHVLFQEENIQDLIESLAVYFKMISQHFRFQVAATNPSGQITTVEMWGVQGNSGTIMLWSYGSNDSVELILLSPKMFIELVRRSTSDPHAFIYNLQNPGSPAASIPKSPESLKTPPESLTRRNQ